MLNINLDQINNGTLVIVAPHMDDEALACGGLIASLVKKEHINIIYATDGMKSPAPVMAGDVVSLDLGEIRVKEAIKAMSFLGVPEENLHFLRLPEGQLKKSQSNLGDLLLEHIKAINPQYIFIPFRYDRHPDHLVINHIISEGVNQGRYEAQLIEYFVYHRWRLLPRKDIRSYVKTEYLFKLELSDVSKRKRQALHYYKSQTSIFYPWQTRPILTSRLLDEECTNPEYFLFHQPDMSDASIFTGALLWIKVVHRVEPLLKDWKYFAGVYLNRYFRRPFRNAG